MYRFTFMLSLIVLAFLASLALADIPKLINYQGMLTNSDGDPLDGTYDVFFRIYNAPSGGDKRWEENHSALSVSQGLFNAILGSQSGGINLDFSENYWLEIQVEGEVMPRIEFASVGYAYRALVADSAYSATPGSGSNWAISNSVLYTNQYWGIARGNAGNELYGNYKHTMVNLGSSCTTGTSSEDIRYATMSGGYGNSATKDGATVGGGQFNYARGEHSVIAGGGGSYASDSNSATGDYSFIGGGTRNVASGFLGTIAGGIDNRVSSAYAAVGGGRGNVAGETDATVAGGGSNTADAMGATVSGGGMNTASGIYSVVGGGGGTAGIYSNQALGDWSTVPGGRLNEASGKYSFAAGRRAKALNHGSFVWADTTDADFAATGVNQFLIRASGGVGIGTTSPGQQLDVDLGNVIVQGTGSFDANGEEGIVYLGSVHHYIKGVYGFGVKIGTYAVGDVVSIEELSGNVGIGTTDPDYKLDVNGDMNVAGSYNVKKGGTNYNHPDYVFEETYELMPLDELKEYVRKNKSLPNVVSAEDVRDNDGFKMDELLIQMLEKVEEQTLYIFQLEERIAELEKKQRKP